MFDRDITIPNNGVHDTMLLCAEESCCHSPLHSLNQTLDVWTLQRVTAQLSACAAVTVSDWL